MKTKRGDGDEKMALALDPVEILRLCRMILMEDRDPFVLSKNQARTLAFLAEWKVNSLQALWKKDVRYFERLWLEKAKSEKFMRHEAEEGNDGGWPGGVYPGPDEDDEVTS